MTDTIKVEALQPGDRIPTDLCGELSVTRAPVSDADERSAEREWFRLYVDVEATRRTSFDPDGLPGVTGAEAAHYLSLTPLRYRLVYPLDATVARLPAPETMTVRVADRRHDPVGHATIRTLTIPATCPVCGGPRGLPYNHNFCDDGDWKACDRWDNPCGHHDAYDGLLAAADAEAGR